MKWRELVLERAPGVTPGLALSDCGPGLNVVFGPNGVGKSTLSRAARAALWRGEDFAGAHLRGRVVSRGDEWAVEREGAHAPQWSGPSTGEPQRPDDRFRGCFHLGLEDLLRQGSTEAAIARELRLEMSGRYDLDAVAVEERKRSANAHFVRTARNELLAARAPVERLEATARELLHREKSLVPLRAELAEQQSITADRAALEDLARVAEQRAELDALRDAAAADDPLLAHFELLDDFERLAKFERERGESRRELRGLRAELEAAEQDLLELSLPADGVDEAVLEEGRSRAQRLRRFHEDVLPPLRTELVGLEAELQGVGDERGEWTREAVEEAQELLDRRRDLRARLAGLERTLELTETRPDSPGDDPWRGVRALLEWCTAEDGGEDRTKGAFGALALAATILVGLIAAGFSGLAVPGWAYAGPLLLVVAAAIHLRGRASNAASTERDLARRRFAESGADEPNSWDGPGVRDALEGLLELRAERDFEAHLRTWSEGLGHRRTELEREAKAIAEQEAALCARLGAGDADELDLRFLLRRLDREGRRRALRAQVEALEAEMADDLAHLQGLLETCGVGRAPDLTAALAGWSDFATRAEREPTRRQAREGAQANLRKAEQRASRASDDRVAFLAARRLAEEQVAHALTLAAGFADHRERRTRLAEMQRDEDVVRRRWAAREDLLALDAEDLSRRLAAGERAVDRVTTLQAEVAKIEAEVERERSDTQLAQREVELREAEDRMDEARDAVLDGVAMDELLSEVRRRHRQEGRPRVLARAERHFADYTRNAYELEDFEGDELSVVETATRRRLSPTQLSSGTRTQLLLALRLAYAESIEGDEMLPIFLDEALLTSDPERFQGVARSLGRMVEDGRQVFYLTAEPREEIEWRNALESERAQVTVHDLGGRRDELQRVAGSSLELAPLPQVPEPVDDDAAAYARGLGGLPPVDGFASADALHLLQLFWDRPRTAYRVLREHRSQVGAVRSFLDQTAEPPWDAADRARFEAYTRLADRVLGLWRVGRAPRLDAETLRESPLAKSSMLDAVIALAEEVAWDGDALLAALRDKRVSGFRTKGIEALQEHLEAGECLAAGSPLDFDDLLARALDEAEPHIDAGALSREDARQLVHRLYQWLGPAPVPAADDARS